jgi:hypothetical protein
MIVRFLLKDGINWSVLHYQNLASRFRSDSRNPLGFFSSTICWL